VKFFFFALIITAVECLTSKGWDNIAIPLTTFILLLFL
jgi:dolichol kinase